MYLLLYRLHLCVLHKCLKPEATQCNKNDVSIAGEDMLRGFKYDRWDDLPCLVNCSERNWITLKLEQGWEGEGQAGVISLEQDAEKSNLLWSDSMKAKNKLTGGSLGSLAPDLNISLLMIIKRRGRKSRWTCVPSPTYSPYTQSRREAHNSWGSRTPFSEGTTKDTTAEGKNPA